MPSQTSEDENVGLRAEVDRLREREAASLEILAVISQNREDEQPVLDAITQNSVKLCDAAGAGLWLLNSAGDVTRLASISQNQDQKGEALVSVGLEFPRENVSAMGQCYRDSRTINMADNRDDPYYLNGDPTARKLVDKVGMRSRLIVPLLENGTAFGCISLHRKVVRAFSDEEVTLIESFAKQAVIAIENVRQFREVQMRLEREKASAEILGVISRSRDDEAPVFKTVLRKARELCDASTAALMLGRPQDETLLLAALDHSDPDIAANIAERIAQVNATGLKMDPAVHVSAGAICEARIVHLSDLRETQSYRTGEPSFKIMVDEQKQRSMLSVPLFDSKGPLGAINLHRQEPGLFSDDEVGLIETFAAQAVIAIENVRQFKALEALNAELGIRVEEQVGEIERMGKLKRFLPAAVADTVVSSGSEKMLKSHRALLGVLFCDIRGFTAFCETAEPEETIEVLQTYHEEMGKLINAHGAGVDHRMGDGIMVLFNDPLPCEDPAGDAVRLAVAMRAKMSDLSQQWKRFGHKLGFGVGVSLGYATVGMVGYEDRSDYTASGTAINVGARLCKMAEDGEILLSTRAAIAVEDDFPSVSAGEVTLKGIREPVEVFRMTDAATG